MCARFGLGLAALRARAQREGWRRADQSDPEPDPELGPEFHLDRPVVTVRQMAAFAWSHASMATVQGRCAEAWRWTRLYEQYRAMAVDDAVMGWSPPKPDVVVAAPTTVDAAAPTPAQQRVPSTDEDDEFDSFDSFDSVFPSADALRGLIRRDPEVEAEFRAEYQAFHGFGPDEPESDAGDPMRAPPPAPRNRGARRRAAAAARKSNGSAPPDEAHAGRSRDSALLP